MGREGELAGLIVGGGRQVIEVGPDPVGQRPEDLIHPEWVGARLGLELLVLEPCQGPTSSNSAQARSSGLPRIRSSTEISTPDAVEAVGCPSAIHCSVPSRRSKAGENWNDLSLKIASVRNFKHSRCLAPGDGHDRVVRVLVGLVIARDRLAADVL